MATPVFPAHVFNPNSVRSYIERKALSGGVSLSGVEDTVITDGGGRWVIEYGDIGLDDPRSIRFWESWNGYLNAGAADVLVPMVSIATAPRPALGTELMQPSDIYANDLLFPTEVRYQAPYIVAQTSTSSPLRATTLAITMQRGAPIEGGERFSIGDRGYRIRRKISEGVFQIEPPLREAVPANTVVNFDWPVVRCRAVPAEDWTPAIEIGLYADASIRFVEVL